MTKKSWSDLFEKSAGSLNTGATASSSTVSHSLSNGSIIVTSAPPSRPSSSAPTSRPSSCAPIEEDEDLPQHIDNEFLSRPVHKLVSARPLHNRGNRCYMIAVLQALLHCAPFCNYFLRYFWRVEGVREVLQSAAGSRFAVLNAFHVLLNEFHHRNQVKSSSSGCIDGEVVDCIFMALPESFSGIGLGEQMDAEEFLTVFLDALAEELMELRRLVPFLLPFESTEQSGKSSCTGEDVDDGEWLQMGPKRTISITRRTPVSQSPIHVLFAGSLKSTFKATGPSRPSITFEPFTVLPLELIDAQGVFVGSVKGAVEHAMRLEYLSTGSKQLSFASLSPLLVIQLKRFLVQPDYSFTKINRAVKIDAHLEINQESFDLVAVVEHHGVSLHGGHYTATVNRRSEWLRFDDELRPQPGNLEDSNKLAYLLFYQRRTQ